MPTNTILGEKNDLHRRNVDNASIPQNATCQHCTVRVVRALSQTLRRVYNVMQNTTQSAVLLMPHPGTKRVHLYRFLSPTNTVDSRFAHSRWETSFQSNTVSHWLGTNLESGLHQNSAYDFLEWKRLGLYSLSVMDSHQQISWNLEDARHGFRVVRPLWNLSSVSAELSKCLSNFRVTRLFQHSISRLRDFARYGSEMYYYLIKKAVNIESIFTGYYWMGPSSW